MRAADRGDLAERLLPIGAALACILHGDGDRRDVEHFLRKLDPVERDALIVVLAGLVDPDTPLSSALGYVTWDEYGRPSSDRPLLAGTIRDIAAQKFVPSGVVELLESELRNAARELYHGVGLEREDVADRLGVPVRAVGRLAKRGEVDQRGQPVDR